MYIIAGLGNPKKEYENTRHNAGFEALDCLAGKYGIRVIERKHKGLVGRGYIDGEKVVLIKPLTFMNLSGESIREVIDYYKVNPESNLIVICDDISLEPGQIRIRKKGSAGGHNGLKNIIANLGHDTFIRVKMGVGEKPAGWDLVDYVLGRFSPKDREAVDEAADRAVDAIRVIIAEGADAAMNRFNGSPKDGGTSPRGKSTVKRDGSRSGEQGTAAEGVEPAEEKNAAQGSPSEGRSLTLQRSGSRQAACPVLKRVVEGISAATRYKKQ